MGMEARQCRRRDGGTVGYRVSGSGRSLVCHPGVSNSGSAYLGDLHELDGVARLVVLDPRGYGASTPAASPAAYGLADHAADLEDLRVELGEDRVAVFGHSGGAVVAMAWAARYPERVRSLVLSNSVPPWSDPEGSGRFFAVVDSRRGEPWFDEAFEALLGQAGLSGKPENEAVETRRRMFHLFIADPLAPGAVEFLERISRSLPLEESERVYHDETGPGFDLRPDLSRVEAPVLVITGEMDPATGGAYYAEATAAVFPNARAVVVPGAGHGLWFEAPERFRAEVAAHLNQTP
jgi:pimeloyl-ACP methyl ester carboxylesterase